VLGGALLAAVAIGCGKEEPPPPTGPVVAPIGVLELPVSLRSGDQGPSGNYKLELSPGGIRLEDNALMALDNGNVPADQVQNGIIPTLKAALTGGRARIALSVNASLPYQTAALVLNTAAAAGIRNASFQVRKPGGAGANIGWMSVDNFAMTAKTDLEVKSASVAPRPWDDFAKSWEPIYDACRGARTGSCAYVQTNVAQGGNLKIVLHASGHGVNINFFRVGIDPESLAAEVATREADIARKKRDFLDGRMKQMDLEAELLKAEEPASQALFQFRSEEALNGPSALSATLRPLCGTSACSAVISADANTLMVRVVSLIGAAFPDGTPPASLAFEMPWTEKPLNAASPLAAARAEAEKNAAAAAAAEAAKAAEPPRPAKKKKRK
jgi:biopolymer transport protein ExbD